jgi:hypothetical protein
MPELPLWREPAVVVLCHGNLLIRAPRTLEEIPRGDMQCQEKPILWTRLATFLHLARPLSATPLTQRMPKRCSQVASLAPAPGVRALAASRPAGSLPERLALSLSASRAGCMAGLYITVSTHTVESRNEYHVHKEGNDAAIAHAAMAGRKSTRLLLWVSTAGLLRSPTARSRQSRCRSQSREQHLQ